VWCIELQNPPFDPLDEIEQARLTNIRDKELLDLTAWRLCRFPGHSRSIYEKAHRLANDLADANPKDGPLLNTLAVACYRLDRFDEALKILTRSLELQGDNATDFLFLAMTHQQLGHPEDAKTFLDRGRSMFTKTKSTLPIISQREIERFVKEAEQTLTAAR
jgi:tetratricopeptide (TPR) repeat protein